ncbi:sugar ABC transporter ATP-binding protein [Treponema parvum]|uniref:Sugar ABC transporter ATP-binding protein n=1 Tax=Treponema parvum TaxID=138851 RepID=A0A975ICN5_9SPIR|nr:sugar ABC transporter ATP-binding protein [Treponema parvum]QTQ12181.1 sugar ABC transporter ATP-binding protein [Treponema parvum]
METQSFLVIDKVSKSFSGNVVLQPFSLEIKPGEFHALIGENGAGKSTLINLVSGVYEPDGGNLIIAGQSYKKLSPREAQLLDIQAVRQELSLHHHLTVTENIFLGDELLYGGFLRDKKKMREAARVLLADMDLGFIDPDAYVSGLSLPEQQLLEFAKALRKKPRLLILDEVTSALNNEQVELMFGKLRALKSTGLAVIFISHRLNELYQICDIMTVLKDGQQIVTEKIAAFDENRLVSLMTGREASDLYPAKRPERLKGAEEVIRLEHVSTRHLRDVSFSVRKGEILGIGGLAGQGQQHVLECLFGIERVSEGRITIKGQPVLLSGPQSAMRLGIAYLPAERKTEGLFLWHSIGFNMSFARLDEISNSLGLIRRAKEMEENGKIQKDMQVRMRGMDQLVEELSGGNQQKVVVGKWLLRSPEFLLLNDPTRGIDVGTKKQIYELLHDLSRNGVTILILSSDTLELVGLSDRVVVFYENKLNSEIDGQDLSEESLVAASVFSREEKA